MWCGPPGSDEALLSGRLLLQKGFVSDPEINNSLLFFIIFQKPCRSLIGRFHQLPEEEAAKVQTVCTYVEALIRVLKMLQ